MQSLPYSPNPGAGKISLRRINPTFIEVETEGTRSEYEFQLLGSHQMSNLSAALECIRSLDLDLSLSMKRIPTLKPVDHRLCPLKTKQGMMIIDDSYNANMGSWKVALDVLKTFDKAKKMIIMSDTEGMGDKAVTNHEQIMHWISSVDNCQLIAIGDLSQMLARQYYHGPLVLCKRAEVISHLSQSNNPDTVVLVKASRSSRLDLLIDEVLLSC